eukprot:CAMPEP_0116915798 /NCGR_PEP_ID=MMETSP0467-20121206/18146_1 /TAXON_ID=283647 /ORGANISM="Mesodinium pulex, Strain SPMC105" /LENGTH=172 /DNA_ID=CAMNT_0004592537 /DNA_START=82 /DNA_END=600 /DNA_ORIENTATION=-
MFFYSNFLLSASISSASAHIIGIFDLSLPDFHAECHLSEQDEDVERADDDEGVTHEHAPGLRDVDQAHEDEHECAAQRLFEQTQVLECELLEVLQLRAQEQEREKQVLEVDQLKDHAVRQIGDVDDAEDRGHDQLERYHQRRYLTHVVQFRQRLLVVHWTRIALSTSLVVII